MFTLGIRLRRAEDKNVTKAEALPVGMPRRPRPPPPSSNVSCPAELALLSITANLGGISVNEQKS